MQSVDGKVSRTNTAEQKSSFPLIAWGWGDLSSQIGKKLASWRVQRVQGYYYYYYYYYGVNIAIFTNGIVDQFNTIYRQ